MIKELRRRIDIQRQKLKDLNKELENVKNNQTEKNTITKVKSTLEGISSRLATRELINELEFRVMEFSVTEQKKKQNEKK